MKTQVIQLVLHDDPTFVRDQQLSVKTACILPVHPRSSRILAPTLDQRQLVAYRRAGGQFAILTNGKKSNRPRGSWASRFLQWLPTPAENLERKYAAETPVRRAPRSDPLEAGKLTQGRSPDDAVQRLAGGPGAGCPFPDHGLPWRMKADY